jgi:cell division septum initiation protein DivIVA
LEIKAKDELDEALRMKAEEELKKLKAADAKLKEELAKLEKELSDAHAEKLNGIKEGLAKDIEALTIKLASTRSNLEDETSEREAAQREVIELKAEISRLTSDYTSSTSRLKDDNARAVSDLNKAHADRVAYESEQHSSEILGLQNQHAEHIASKDGEISNLHSDIETLNERWLARESRPVSTRCCELRNRTALSMSKTLTRNITQLLPQEDLELIENLQRELVEKEALVKKTKEEMIYFKRVRNRRRFAAATTSPSIM